MDPYWPHPHIENRYHLLLVSSLESHSWWKCHDSWRKKNRYFLIHHKVPTWVLYNERKFRWRKSCWLIKITFMRHGKLQKQRSNRKCLYFYEQKCQIIEEDQRKFGLMLMNWEKLARSCLFRFFLQCLCLQEKGKNLCIWGDWKDSSVVKSRYCSCRGPELISEHLSQAVYHCL